MNLPLTVLYGKVCTNDGYGFGLSDPRLHVGDCITITEVNQDLSNAFSCLGIVKTEGKS